MRIKAMRAIVPNMAALCGRPGRTGNVATTRRRVASVATAGRPSSAGRGLDRLGHHFVVRRARADLADVTRDEHGPDDAR
jgi:hypothetical protein